MSRQLFWMFPVSFCLGALLSFLQPGNFWIGWLSFSVLFLLSSFLFAFLHRWAGGGRVLGWMIALAFALRLATGVGLYLALPVDGYNEPDDRTGFFFTDAHRRDDQAWELAQSDDSIFSAFNKTYHTDQYGGLLAFTSLAYRVLSPDAHRPLLLIALSAIVATLGIPFFWRAALLAFGEQVALPAGWILPYIPKACCWAVRPCASRISSPLERWLYGVSWTGSSTIHARLSYGSVLAWQVCYWSRR